MPVESRKHCVLVGGDELATRVTLAKLLGGVDDDVAPAPDAGEALSVASTCPPPCVVVNDVRTPVLEAVREGRAWREATDGMPRPHHDDAETGIEGVVGSSPAMKKVYAMARRVAGSRSTVLLTGESGTGKGELARALHALGPRAEKPFVTVHGAALAESLLESELFGHERGAFTGADRRRAGRFEQAGSGTLFLDEVGELSLATQTKLLRVLQERAFERVGGNETLTVDARLIVATNRDLSAEVRAGRFREDLYYRLNVIHIELPPLRDRLGDVLLLADHFLRKYASDNHKTIDGFSEAAKSKLLRQPWFGNVRELENTIERGAILCEGAQIEASDIPLDPPLDPSSPVVRIPGSSMAEIEKHAILKTLEATGGSASRTAKILRLSVRKIQYRMQEYEKHGWTARR